MKKKLVKQKKLTRSKKAPSEAAYLQVDKKVWPLERDVLFRPDRLKYVRKLIPSTGCVFCAAATAEPSFDNLCVYKSKLSMIVLNKYPYNPGHLLVLPRQHQGDLLALSSDQYADLHLHVKKAISAVQEIYEPGGYNLGMNLGATAGAGIPAHLHYHIVPRWGGDLNFFPLIGETKVVVENLEVTFDRLRTYFEKIRP